MFEEIIQYLLESGQIHIREAHDYRFFIEELESQTELAKKRLLAALEKFNYETIEPRGAYQYFPFWELGRGSGDFETSVMLDWNGGIESLEDLKILERPSSKWDVDEFRIFQAEKIRKHKELKIDHSVFPVSRLEVYSGFRYQQAIYLSWVSSIWQEIEGQRKSGMKAKTCENNSAATFSLNDFLDYDFSKFMEGDYGTKPPRLGPYFPRKLTITELFMRASQTGFPFNPYKNYWRYFEKNGHFKEIVTWDSATGIREGNFSEKMTARVGQIIQHENPKTALLQLTEFTNRAIFDGWEEKLRPIGLPEKMHVQAFDFEYWTGINRYDRENRLTPKAIEGFAARHDLRLPKAFAEFLRLFGGKTSGNYPINDLYNLKVKQFFTLAELESIAIPAMQNSPGWLPIAPLEADGFWALGIDQTDAFFGKTAIIRADGQVDVCDYSFEKSARFAQGDPVQPEIFAAQENDAAFLKKRLAEGWDATTSYAYKTAIEEAAEHNAHDALEVLLQAGMRLRHPNHREFAWRYDEKTMDILDGYSKG